MLSWVFKFDAVGWKRAISDGLEQQGLLVVEYFQE